jgi:hypothetical protein
MTAMLTLLRPDEMLLIHGASRTSEMIAREIETAPRAAFRP